MRPKKLFVLVAYILLAFGALIYGNLITLNLDFTWKNNVLIAEVPRDLEQASLFLEFKTHQTGSFPIKVVSATAEISDGPLVLEDSSDFHNFSLLKKVPKIDRGGLELQFEKPLDISEVRIEYRYSALRYYWEGLKIGDSSALILLIIWLILFGAGILLWKFGLKTKLLMVVTFGHLCFLWMVFAPLSGYDDTYHLPGAALMATPLNRDEVRLETVKLIKDSKYMSIRRVPRAVEKELNGKNDFCPHVLSFPDLAIEGCPYGDDFNLKIYSRILKFFSLQSVPAVEIGLKIVNQIVFLLAVLVLAGMFSMLFELNWSRGFRFMLAASLSFFPLLPQTMTTGHDLLFFLLSSMGLWLMTRIWKSESPKEKALCLLLSFFLVYPFIMNAGENNKTYLILVIPALALITFLYSSSKNVRLILPALLLVVPVGWFLWKSFSPFYSSVLFPFLTGRVNLEPFSLLSAPKVIELSLDEVIGSVISGKIYPPSPVKALYLFLLVGLGWTGMKRFFSHDKYIGVIMLTLFLGVVGILLALGGLTLRDVWISLRFTYALAPVFWLLYSAGFLENEDFNTAPALVAIVAVNTVYLPAFVFPLLN